MLDNLTVADIDMLPDGTPGPEEDRRPSFCLRHKAMQAAEAFLLARYQLYTQVYLHKTTRGVEAMIAALLTAVADLVRTEGGAAKLRLPEDHPLVAFFREPTPKLESYLALDDTVMWGAIERLAGADDSYVSDLATRLRSRRFSKGLDFESAFGATTEAQRNAKKRIDKANKDGIGRTVLKDEATVSIYGQIGADDTKAHKRLMILMSDDRPYEIVDVSEIVKIAPQKTLIRYYFSTESARVAARASKQRELHDR